MTELAAAQAFASRYALNETRFGIKRKPVKELPIIDVGALIHGGTEAEIDTVADKIREACINSGFFYITNYGISDKEMYEIANMATRFFQLPIEQKQKAQCRDYTEARGYQPMNSEKITPGYEPDYKEYYDMGLELSNDSLEAIDRGATLWPDDDALPGFRQLMQAHVQRTLKIGQSIIRGFARALDLPDTFFDEAHNPPFYNFRPSYYPPAKDILKQNLWSCGPHTDYMSMTMLWQDKVGGLQVLNLDGEWIDAPPLDETMVLNIADMMSIWTNDLFTSNPHRVANRTTDHRLSLAHFIGPGASTNVTCLPTCMGENNPARYSSTTTTQHIANIMSQALDPEIMKKVKLEKQDVTEQLRSAERIGG
jgi:isopenicillin N synthase-like dioxygenase